MDIDLDLLELLGVDYVIEKVVDTFNQRAARKIYRNYMADILKAVAESMGVQVDYRYAELVEPDGEEEKTGDEIALEVIERAGLVANGST